MKMQKSAEMTDSYQNIDRVTCGYYNETEVIPGVIVKAIPTQAGLLPLVPEPFIPILAAPSSKKQYEMFILSEEFIEFHFLCENWGCSEETQMTEFSLIDSNAEIANEGQVQWLN